MARRITHRYETRLYRSSRKVRMRRHGLEELDVRARPDDLILLQRTPQECERLSSVLAVHDEFRDLTLDQHAFPLCTPVSVPRQSTRIRIRQRLRLRFGGRPTHHGIVVRADIVAFLEPRLEAVGSAGWCSGMQELPRVGQEVATGLVSASPRSSPRAQNERGRGRGRGERQAVVIATGMAWDGMDWEGVASVPITHRSTLTPLVSRHISSPQTRDRYTAPRPASWAGDYQPRWPTATPPGPLP